MTTSLVATISIRDTEVRGRKSVTDTWQRIHFASAAKSGADTSTQHSCITSDLSPTVAHMTKAI